MSPAYSAAQGEKIADGVFNVSSTSRGIVDMSNSSVWGWDRGTSMGVVPLQSFKTFADGRGWDFIKGITVQTFTNGGGTPIRY